jgi:hypothetical protein
MMKVVLAVASTAALAGCGTIPSSSGVMQLGPDTYRVAARGPMGAVHKSQQIAFAEANGHCQGMGREIMVVGTRAIEDVGGGPYEVTFRCLRAGDADLMRPTLTPVPDKVIQLK